MADLLLEMLDVLLLVTALLGIGGCTDIVLKCDRIAGTAISVRLPVLIREEALPLKQVDAVEPVVAPALTDLEVRGEFADDLHPTWLPVVDHLNAVLVLRRLTQSLKHLQEDTDVVALGDPVTIRVDFEPPGEPVEDQGVRIDDLVGVSQP